MGKLSPRYIYRSFKMSWYRLRYSLKNVHSTFYMGGRSLISSDLVAKEYVYIAPNCWIPPNVHIGKYSMLAPGVAILGGDHIFDKPKTPIIFSGRPKTPKTSIGADVWIGANVLIMSGVTINDGAIIAAGSVVTKDILPYEIYAGNPAKYIRMRFNEEEIKQHKEMLLKPNIEVNLTAKKKTV